jgi:hypothetical protein
MAREKLEATLRELATGPDKAIRIIPSSTVPDQLDLILDTEREGDRVILGFEASNLLLIGSDIAEDLVNKVVDYRDTPDGPGFVIDDRAIES